MATIARENGKQVYYEDHGKGATAVLLIHGWGMSCRAWDNVLPGLVDAGYRVVLLDHRGCGASDKDFADMSIAAIASDALAIADELALERVVVNGWSLGGAVATEVAAALGDRCRALVLTGGASPIYTQKTDLPLGGTDADLAATVEAIRGNRIEVLTGLANAVCAKDPGEALLGWMGRVFCESSPMAVASLGDLANVDQRELLSGLDLPVLSFVGSEDGFVAPDIGRWIGEHCPRGRVIEYEGVGHAPFIEVTQQYNEALRSFIAEVA